MRQKIMNWGPALVMVLCVAALCYGLTYDAADKATFQNAYAWSGHPQKDKAWDWAVEMQALTEAGITLGTGKIFYVDSGVTTEGNGSSWARAKDTLDEAINLCTTNRGDVIFVAQGHSETMGAAADEVDIDLNGIRVIGFGTGTLRPLFDWTSHIGTGSFNIGADNITLYNLVFNANTADCNEAVNIAAGSTDCTIVDCDFTTTTDDTDEFYASIDSIGAASDRLTIIGCNIHMDAGAAVAGIQTLDSDYMVIKNCYITGDYSTANISNITTESNYVLIANNTLYNGDIGGDANLNTEPCIEVDTNTSGVISNNVAICDTAAFINAIVADECYYNENYTSQDSSGTYTTIITGAVSTAN